MSFGDSYQNCLNEMYGLRRFGIKLDLDTIRQILAGLGNPHEQFNKIHVAGTNGKGSVAATLTSILSSCGYKTGLYTSPHLVRFNERIVIDRQPIADHRVVEAYRAVDGVHNGERQPTFFECATAMAFYEFQRQGVEWAVIETGMGGRLDATNVIRPAISIITNVSLEHREYLGRTIRQIAAEKAGIIKTGVPVVTSVRQKSAVDVVTAAAREHGAPIFRLGKEFKVRRIPDGTFTYRGLQVKWRQLRTPLLGVHQIENAALALAACEVLTPALGRLSVQDIHKGLHETQWPGRLEKVCERPLILLDGAHNLMAARTLAKYLATHLAGRRITLVVGILDDKPYRAMLDALLPHSDRVIVTQPKINRALPVTSLYAAAVTGTATVTSIADVGQALAAAVASAEPDDVICVAGSLYVVGEAKAALAHLEPPLPA